MKVTEQYRQQEMGFRDENGEQYLILRRYYDDEYNKWGIWFIPDDKEIELTIDFLGEETLNYVSECFKQAEKVFRK